MVSHWWGKNGLRSSCFKIVSPSLQAFWKVSKRKTEKLFAKFDQICTSPFLSLFFIFFDMFFPRNHAAYFRIFAKGELERAPCRDGFLQRVYIHRLQFTHVYTLQEVTLIDLFSVAVFLLYLLTFPQHVALGCIGKSPMWISYRLFAATCCNPWLKVDAPRYGPCDSMTP